MHGFIRVYPRPSVVQNPDFSGWLSKTIFGEELNHGWAQIYADKTGRQWLFLHRSERRTMSPLKQATFPRLKTFTSFLPIYTNAVLFLQNFHFLQK
jgi:hypothetical protein